MQNKLNHIYKRLSVLDENSLEPKISNEAELRFRISFEFQKKHWYTKEIEKDFVGKPVLFYSYFDGSFEEDGDGWNEPRTQDLIPVKSWFEIKDTSMKSLYKIVEELIEEAQYNENWEDDKIGLLADMAYDNSKY